MWPLSKDRQRINALAHHGAGPVIADGAAHRISHPCAQGQCGALAGVTTSALTTLAGPLAHQSPLRTMVRLLPLWKLPPDLVFSMCVQAVSGLRVDVDGRPLPLSATATRLPGGGAFPTADG